MPLRDRLGVEAMLQYQKDPAHEHLCAVTDGSGLFHVCPTAVDVERPELAGLGWNASHSWDFCGERFAGPWRPAATEVSVHAEVSAPPAPEAPQLPEREAEPPEEPRPPEEPVTYRLPPVPAASAEDLRLQGNDVAELQAAQTAQRPGRGSGASSQACRAVSAWVCPEMLAFPCVSLAFAALTALPPRACMPLMPARKPRHLRRADFLVACA